MSDKVTISTSVVTTTNPMRPLYETFIEQTVEVGGPLKAATSIHLAGTVRGDVECLDLLVAGTLHADTISVHNLAVSGVVYAREIICNQLRLTSEAKVIADEIQVVEISTQPGAKLEGKIKMVRPDTIDGE